MVRRKKLKEPRKVKRPAEKFNSETIVEDSDDLDKLCNIFGVTDTDDIHDIVGVFAFDE